MEVTRGILLLKVIKLWAMINGLKGLIIRWEL